MTQASVPLGNWVFDRMVSAVEKVRERMFRAAAALEAAGIPYAVIGGNAVAAWVATVNPKATRNTADVDILLRQEDMAAAAAALTPAGFTRAEVMEVPMFLDGADSDPSDAVHIIYASEKVRPTDSEPAPPITDSQMIGDYRVVTLEALVRMKLTSFRRKDQVHIQDLIGVGLVDRSWLSRFPPELATRLQELLDDPNG